MIVKKIQKNNICSSSRIIEKNRGFVILFAVTLSAILLSIALGVANISLKEIKFGTSAKDTNNAFFAADTGIEKVLFNDRSSGSSYVPAPGTIQSWEVIILGLGSDGESCAKVSIEKDNSVPPLTKTTIISRGYNIGNDTCSSSNPDRIEREIEARY